VLLLPVQVPSVPTRVCERCTVPLTEGRTVFAGGEAMTCAVATLVAVAMPSALVTVTSRRT
jgi:hypothetical protein